MKIFHEILTFRLMILICIYMSLTVVMSQRVFAMGNTPDCVPSNSPAIHATTTQSLSLTNKIKREALKNPTRFRYTLSVINSLERDLQKVKAVTNPANKRRVPSNDSAEISRIAQNGISIKKNYGNAMDAMFSVFRESIEEQNADKKYWTNKLKEMNEISEALGDYLSELNNAAQEATDECNDKTTPVKSEELRLKPSQKPLLRPRR